MIAEFDYLRGYIAFLKQQDEADEHEIDRTQNKIDTTLLHLARRVCALAARKMHIGAA